LIINKTRNKEIPDKVRIYIYYIQLQIKNSITTSHYYPIEYLKY